jgi:hypothetical protein
LNFDSILNKFFLSQVKCQSACYNDKFKMGSNVEFGWEMGVWELKEKTLMVDGAISI